MTGELIYKVFSAAQAGLFIALGAIVIAAGLAVFFDRRK